MAAVCAVGIRFGLLPLLAPSNHCGIVGLGQGVCDLAAFFDSLLKKGRKEIKEINAKITGRQVVDGVDCIVVEWGFEVTEGSEKGTRWVYNFWVSPDRGYTLTQCKEWRVRPQSEERELAVDAQCETVCNGGVWVPRRYSETQYDLDRGGGTAPGISSLCVTTCDDNFAWNKAVSSDDLTLVLPSGTQVHDFALDSLYAIP